MDFFLTLLTPRQWGMLFFSVLCFIVFAVAIWHMTPDEPKDSDTYRQVEADEHQYTNCTACGGCEVPCKATARQRDDGDAQWKDTYPAAHVEYGQRWSKTL